MSVKNEFSKYANQYNSHNIIQQIVAKSIVRDIDFKPKKILELGCGSGQIIKNINWDYEKYTAIDFSKDMCEIHPKDKNVEVYCFDFDSKEFRSFLQDKDFDVIISASAMQWSKDLDLLVKCLSKTSKRIFAALFTSNTFKTIQNITATKSPILDEKSIKNAFTNYYDCEFETHKYSLEFDNKKDLFDYIKKSGVSGGSSLSFKDAKKLYKEYDLSYLEFEVMFIKAFSKI